MPVRNTQYFVDAIRQISNTERDPIVSDNEVADRATDALMSLYDLLIGAYEHYAVKTVDFTLVGGVGNNTFPLPTDFYKDVSLDLNPTSTPITIHRFSSWVERNNLPRWSYIVFDDMVVVSPPQISAGAYRFYYTPLQMPFGLPLAPATPDPGDAVDGTMNQWFFINGAFDSTYVGATMTVTGCSNPINNGTFTVLSVTDAQDIVTNGPTGSEVFGLGATFTFQPGGTINVLPQIFAPWYEYIQVHGAIAVKDKIEQDTSDLEARLANLTQRIQSMAANRMEEGGQIGLVRRGGGNYPGQDNGWPFWD